MRIEVLKDTKIIEENTKDSLQVRIENDSPVIGESIEIQGRTVKGDNLIVTDVSFTSLGYIKTRIEQIDSEITRLQAEKTQLLSRQTIIEPELDKAIIDILKDPTSEDRRTPVIEEVIEA